MPLSPSLRATAVALFTTLVGCGAARAADLLNPGLGLYAGGTLGAIAVTPDGLKSDNKTDGEADASGGVFAGVHLATLPVAGGWPLYLEAAYQDIARHTLRYKVQNSSADLTAEGHAVSLAARLSMPVTAHFGFYSRLGVARAKVDGSTPTGQPVIAVKGSATGLVSGFGLEYQFASGPVLRGELTRYHKVSPRTGAAAFTLGMGFAF